MCLGLAPCRPKTPDGDENHEESFSDKEQRKRGPLNNLKWLIPAQPTCHHHQGVWREEEKPRSPTDTAPAHSSLAQGGVLRSQN